MLCRLTFILCIVSLPALIFPGFLTPTTPPRDPYHWFSAQAQPSVSEKPVVSGARDNESEPESDQALTAKQLIEIVRNQDLDFEQRFDIFSQATQLPRSEYITVLEAAAAVENTEIASVAIKILIELDGSTSDSFIQDKLLNLPPEAQSSVLISIIERMGLNPKQRLKFIAVTILRQNIRLIAQAGTGNAIALREATPPAIPSNQASTKSQAEVVGFAALIIANDPMSITTEEHVLLKSALLQFPKTTSIWLAASLSKDAAANLKSGRSIYTNARENQALRMAVAVAIAPSDPQAAAFYKKKIENILASAKMRKQVIAHVNPAKQLSAKEIKEIYSYYSDLSYIGWLRFYYGADAFNLTWRCLDSNDQTIQEYAALVAVRRFPKQFLIYSKKEKTKGKSSSRRNYDNFLVLLALTQPAYAASVRTVIKPGYLMHAIAKIKAVGITGFFEGGSASLGLT